jgi:hypothetical protein
MRVSVGFCFVSFSLLSAPSPCVRGTLRARRLSLAVHAVGYRDRRDWSYWGIGEVVQIFNLILKKVHSHTEQKEFVLWHRGQETARSGLEIREVEMRGIIPRYGHIKLSAFPSNYHLDHV